MQRKAKEAGPYQCFNDDNAAMRRQGAKEPVKPFSGGL
jgi:hypothetical protein